MGIGEEVWTGPAWEPPSFDGPGIGLKVVKSGVGGTYSTTCLL